MADPTRGWTRALRCGVLAAVVVALATVAHVLGGGAEPSQTLLGALFALTCVPCAVVTARRLAGPWLLAIVGGGEWALHHALMLGTADQMGGMQMAGMHMTGMQAAGMQASGTAGMAAQSEALTAVPWATSAGMPMLAGHAAAAVVSAVVLAHGERVCWQLCLGLPFLRLLFGIHLSPITPRPVPTPDADSFVSFTGLGCARALRGPPAFDGR
jgi:hypothetical protein